jgi:predicted outer membrane repeat protein
VIDAVPAGGLTISGGGLSRVFEVDGGVTASLSGLTITGGSTGGDGGALYNDGGNVTMTNCVINGNASTINAPDTGGGGVANAGTITLTATRIRGNMAAADGGGLCNSGMAALLDCLVAGNSAASGGGIYAAAGGSVTLAGTRVIHNKKDNIVGTVTYE